MFEINWPSAFIHELAIMVKTLRDFFRDETIPAGTLIQLIKNKTPLGEDRDCKKLEILINFKFFAI